MKQYKVYTKERGLVETNFNDDTIRNLTWHREDGPAVISHENGVLIFEEYWFNRQLHRLDGPASIWYDMDGNIKKVEYYINHISYTKENYMKELLKLKINLL